MKMWGIQINAEWVKLSFCEKKNAVKHLLNVIQAHPDLSENEKFFVSKQFREFALSRETELTLHANFTHCFTVKEVELLYSKLDAIKDIITFRLPLVPYANANDVIVSTMRKQLFLNKDHELKQFISEYADIRALNFKDTSYHNMLELFASLSNEYGSFEWPDKTDIEKAAMERRREENTKQEAEMRMYARKHRILCT